ncbi:PIN-like domain-containing protein [Saccharothrix syringae]|uniref:PIN like domain-containing protein n=1 Tax=Saccharothrix syringae TaxID=103733 RepID=A0A5Q0GUU2_SACSY|nr:PIN-like domain-containing protein [Saccharothrix syringae]QFZ17681.1 hypothetical protein EKG83_09455 [Saccharothrix syringae]
MADESAEPRGILDGFGAYRTARPDHYRDLFTRGMVVLDTGVLLDCYRYTAATRADFVRALRRVRDRLWVPHQVLAEFWHGREAALAAAGRATARAVERVRLAEEQALRELRTWADRVSCDPGELAGLERVLRDAHEQVAARLAEVTRVVDAEEDPVVADLDGLLYGRVGEPPPPGEREDDPVWRQILAEAARRRRDVLLVADDTARDWWRLDEDGTARGPRPDRYEELRAVAGVRLFLMRPETFLRHVREHVGEQAREKPVDEVERVRRQEHASALQVLALDFVEVFLARDLMPDYHTGEGHVLLRAGEAGGRWRAFLVDPPFADPAAAAKWVGRLVRGHAEAGDNDVVVFRDRPGDRLLDGLANLDVAAMWRAGDAWEGSGAARERGWLAP